MELAGVNLLEFGNTIQIGGMVMRGNGKHHTFLFPDEDEDEKLENSVTRLTTEEWKALIQQTDVTRLIALPASRD